VAFDFSTAEQIDEIEHRYNPVPTVEKFHLHPGQMRCIVGPVGSGKTTGATWDVCRFIPEFLAQHWGYKKSRWVIVRNTYDELIDTTQATVFEWFDWGNYRVQRKILTLFHHDLGGYEVEILFRSCDNPKDVKKFKSLEITGYWIDESIEVAQDIKKMLKNRIGRYPKAEQVAKWFKQRHRYIPKEW
jgi:phage terminase large subunit